MSTWYSGGSKSLVAFLLALLTGVLSDFTMPLLSHDMKACLFLSLPFTANTVRRAESTCSVLVGVLLGVVTCKYDLIF